MRRSDMDETGQMRYNELQRPGIFFQGGDSPVVPIGLYIHVPFCLSKCPYCDFYSLSASEEALDAYTQAACRCLRRWADRLQARADTLYLGGGTPSLLGGARLTALLETARAGFGLEGAEITLEANPADDLADTLRAFAAAGGNRLSLGMQSASPRELRFLGRRHSPADVERTVRDARRAGIGNLSLDLMLALPGQTAQNIARSAAVCRELGAEHVSAYLLKIEPGTPFAGRDLALPDGDEAADLYLAAARALEGLGYRQYEISNFARPGRESRHNLKYWDLRPYLGIGPAAHSLLGGRRFAYPRDLRAFLDGAPPQAEEPGDSPARPGEEAAVQGLPEDGWEEIFQEENLPEEYLMLRLRLTDGLRESEYAARFGGPIPALWRERAAALPPSLIQADGEGIRLTREGFLVSNAVIARLLYG